jgi:hypothetical protein
MKYPRYLFLEIEFWKWKGHKSSFISDKLSIYCTKGGFVVMIVFDELFW